EGAWGPLAAKASEKIRRELDFDHWAAFRESFHKLRKLLHEVACGERGGKPASVVVLSGDVHHAYLAEVAYRGSTDRAPVYQAVCSPYRNPLDEKERRVVRMGFTSAFTRFAALLARAAGADDPGIRWRTLEGPHFDNQVATLQIDRRQATMRLDKTVPGEDGKEALVKSFSRRLA
ncbi:MAG TPA: alkaline phosphatase family protein, partial [Solirubrobacterales bacterium]|nr:alkaline phosphatase family protein [Solirubrobacterales bacterium]